LARHYPPAARQHGLAGKAVVKARIGADGKARVLAVVSESGDGFGAACRRTLDGTRWEPPIDQRGRAVDTVLAYTCRFEVGS
ncbi:MAG: energy transducer TonB, partial [Deltaproteobacteria bacterium]|nr:energy transducer TonB [Kofleriaceae bacterium]